jgi:DNA polymerase-3 subunit alpha
MTFDKAIEQSQELANVLSQDEDAQKIIAISRKLEGNHRHASVHAAGVIITPTKLTDFTALQWDSDRKGVVCQVDMNSAEKAGMVKMDFLGIRNLSILGNAIALVESRHDTNIDLTNVNLRSKKAFELLAKGRTMGIFQLSGGGITKFLIDLVPSRVEDLMAMVALYRPGPMPNIPEYIKRKHDASLIQYYVPQMEKWMKDSYGILVYQDDLLYTVIELAGYDWAEVDVFRKGVGKKIRAVIDSQHEKFVLGCQSHSGLTAETAEFLWSLMEPFAAYGFNKAHAASYGMVSYWTAYMKGEFTVEFMTTLMTEESNNLDKVAASIKECQELNIEVLAPDINQSGDSFTIITEHQIRYGLGSVKNLGSDVIKNAILERQKHGLFSSFEDFIERISKHNGFNKRSLEALIHAGCLDILAVKVVEDLKLFSKPQFVEYKDKNTYILLRSFLFANVEVILEALAAFKHGTQVESDSLFGFDTDLSTQNIAWNSDFSLYSKQQILSNEKEALGIYLTDNPMREFGEVEQRIQTLLGKADYHLCLITKVKKIFTKTNNLMFALQVMTPSDSFEAVIFPKNAMELSGRLEENQMFWIKGKISLPAAKKKDEQTQYTELIQTDESLKKMVESDDPDFVAEVLDIDESAGTVQNYEEIPKILVDNLVLFNLGVAPLLHTEKEKERFTPILEQIQWSELFNHPEEATNLIPLKKSRAKMSDRKTEDDLNQIEQASTIEITPIDDNMGFDAGEQNMSFDYKYEQNHFENQSIDQSNPQLADPKQDLEYQIKINLEPQIIRIAIVDGHEKLKNIKKLLQETPGNGLIPVQLEVEVSPGEWKRTKKIYFIAQVEFLRL